MGHRRLRGPVRAVEVDPHDTVELDLRQLVEGHLLTPDAGRHDDCVQPAGGLDGLRDDPVHRVTVGDVDLVAGDPGTALGDHLLGRGEVQDGDIPFLGG